MKSKFLALALVAATAGAFAGPLPSLSDSGYVIKFAGLEQIAIQGTTGYGNEINWGVMVIESIKKGIETPANSNLLNPSGPNIFSDDGLTGQITGMFYGIEKYTCTTPGCDPFPATGGFLDLYYRDLSSLTYTDLAVTSKTVRTGLNSATGFTDGTLLVRIEFASGINFEDGLFISGDTIPTQNVFQGIAQSYGNVDTTAGGLWANKFDADPFEVLTDAGAQTRDFRFKNSYNYNSTWDGCVGPAGTTAPGVCVGASLDDPAFVYAVPEPGSLVLVGLGLLAFGATRRRKA